MLTNRVRIKRTARSHARAIYKDALKLQDMRWDCIRSIACRSPAIGERCPECLKYMDTIAPHPPPLDRRTPNQGEVS